MELAEALNRDCACTTLQESLLAGALAQALPTDEPDIRVARPHLFSASPVFLRAADAVRIRESVATLHRVAGLPRFRQQSLARAPAIAQQDPGASGVFMGYDFHIAPPGPRLIEINTNAGGALLHATALQAHRGCCGDADHPLPTPADLPGAWVRMFQAEWQAAGRDTPLRRIAIVDDAPATQYLAPEFALARALFVAHGFEAVIADPRELAFDGKTLRHGSLPIDLVYNRLTDFYLEEASHAALRAAHEAAAVVLTPHPHAHAVHADKRNLVVLGDAERMAEFGADAADAAMLRQVVPRTQLVTADNAKALWAARRGLFFKPAGGYGAKAAYRGDKLTRRAWDDVCSGGFVAQDLVMPSERVVPLADGSTARLRLDVRAYAFLGEVLLLAARTWAGQTTNFRTPGGGFSPVVVVPDLATSCPDAP